MADLNPSHRFGGQPHVAVVREFPPSLTQVHTGGWGDNSKFITQHSKLVDGIVVFCQALELPLPGIHLLV